MRSSSLLSAALNTALVCCASSCTYCIICFLCRVSVHFCRGFCCIGLEDWQAGWSDVSYFLHFRQQESLNLHCAGVCGSLFRSDSSLFMTSCLGGFLRASAELLYNQIRHLECFSILIGRFHPSRDFCGLGIL